MFVLDAFYVESTLLEDHGQAVLSVHVGLQVQPDTEAVGAQCEVALYGMSDDERPDDLDECLFSTAVLARRLDLADAEEDLPPCHASVGTQAVSDPACRSVDNGTKETLSPGVAFDGGEASPDKAASSHGDDSICALSDSGADERESMG